MFLRLRKAVRKHGLRVMSVAPVRHPGADQDGRPAGRWPLLAARPRRWTDCATTCPPGRIILVGERLADRAGCLLGGGATRRRHRRPDWPGYRAAPATAAHWRPGACPNLLPGGRPVADARPAPSRARRGMSNDLPATPGRDTSAILAAAASGELRRAAHRRRRGRRSARPGGRAGRHRGRRRSSSASNCGTARSPTAPTWCSRWHRSSRRPAPSSTGRAGPGPFGAALPPSATSDMRVLAALADEVGVDLGLTDAAAVGPIWPGWALWQGRPAAAPSVPAADPASRARVRRSWPSWRMLLDAGRLQDGEPHLAGTARPAVVRLSAATAAEIGGADGDLVTVAPTAGPSACRWRSPRCPTGWCGCR